MACHITFLSFVDFGKIKLIPSFRVNITTIENDKDLIIAYNIYKVMNENNM